MAVSCAASMASPKAAAYSTRRGTTVITAQQRVVKTKGSGANFTMVPPVALTTLLTSSAALLLWGSVSPAPAVGQVRYMAEVAAAKQQVATKPSYGDARSKAADAMGLKGFGPMANKPAPAAVASNVAAPNNDLGVLKEFFGSGLRSAE